MFKVDSVDFEASFTKIAFDLFNHYIIQVNDTFYRLLEIEFYYKDEHNHNDTYTHGHKYQKRSSYWYFHPSGIDITIGNENAAGGILLRSIEKLSPEPPDKREKYFFGPHKVLTELTSGLHSCFSSEPNTFSLIPAKESKMQVKLVPQEDVIRCARIGLSEKDEAFHKALYRYLIYPHLPHKEKMKIAESLASQWGTGKEILDRIKGLMGSEFLGKYR